MGEKEMSKEADQQKEASVKICRVKLNVSVRTKIIFRRLSFGVFLAASLSTTPSSIITRSGLIIIR